MSFKNPSLSFKRDVSTLGVGRTLLVVVLEGATAAVARVICIVPSTVDCFRRCLVRFDNVSKLLMD